VCPHLRKCRRQIVACSRTIRCMAVDADRRSLESLPINFNQTPKCSGFCRRMGIVYVRRRSEQNQASIDITRRYFTRVSLARNVRLMELRPLYINPAAICLKCSARLDEGMPAEQVR